MCVRIWRRVSPVGAKSLGREVGYASMCPALRDAFTQESGLDAVATTFSMPTRVAHIAPGEVLTLDAEDLPFSLPFWLTMLRHLQLLACSRKSRSRKLTSRGGTKWKRRSLQVTPPETATAECSISSGLLHSFVSPTHSRRSVHVPCPD